MLTRVPVVLLALALGAAAAILGLVPDQLLATGEAALGTVRSLEAGTRTTIAIVLAALAGVLLVLALWPQRRQVVRAGFDGGMLEYDGDTVARLLERHVARLEGVRGARVSTRTRQEKVDVLLRVATADGFEPREVGRRAASEVREKVERGFGLSLGQLRLVVAPAPGTAVAPAAAPTEGGRLAA